MLDLEKNIDENIGGNHQTKCENVPDNIYTNDGEMSKDTMYSDDETGAAESCP